MIVTIVKCGLTLYLPVPHIFQVFIFYQHIKYHILNMLKIKCDIKSKIWKELISILSNMNNFHSLEVVDRISETQLQVGENSNWFGG